MSVEIINGYKLKCLNCDYIWETRYNKIPAKCPSCNTLIYKSNNYEIVTKFIHHELTEEEKIEMKNLISLWILLFILFIPAIFIIGFLFSLFLFVGIYYSFKFRKRLKEGFKDLFRNTK